MTDTPLLGLPYLDAAQAQKHVTHNEALRILDACVHLAVVSRLAAPPSGAPDEGARYLVAEGATDAFAGHADAVAAWQDSAWRFLSPRAGWRLYVLGEDRDLLHDGVAWRDAHPPPSRFDNLIALGLGTEADAANPFAARLDAALFTARAASEGGGDLRVKLNKNAAANVASQIFQTGYSGRAEIGLRGDDDFSVAVSADGQTFKTVLRATAANGGALVAATPLRLAGQGAPPPAPEDGDLWYDASDKLFRCRANGRANVFGVDETPVVAPDIGRYIRTTTGCSTTTTTTAGVADRIDIYPFVPRFDMTVDRLGASVAVGSAGSLGRLLVYGSNADGRPDARMFESGDLDFSTVGAKEALTALGFRKGRQYWLGLRQSATASVYAWQLHNTPDLDQPSMAGNPAKILRRVLSHATPAPAVWAYVAAETTTGVAPPAIWLRVA